MPPVTIRIAEIELSQNVAPIWVGDVFGALRVLVRVRGRPLGWIEINPIEQPEVTADCLRAAVAKQLGFALLPHVFLPSIVRIPNAAPRPVSVVVCTHNRTKLLERCLKGLGALDYPEFEIIVVDNAPSDETTAALAAQFPVRYVREEQRGLDYARNRGIAEARFELIAFVDDDAFPDKYWLSALNDAFADPQVAGVTGLVVPKELDTESQIRFELGYGGMGHGFQKRTLHRRNLSNQELMWASAYGVGANMAFRCSVLKELDGFDVGLDVGTPARGHGDVEMLHRLLVGGYTLVYEPAALVWHTHRRAESLLHQQMFANGCSTGAYVLTCRRNRTVPPAALAEFFLRDWLGWWVLRRLVWPGMVPRSWVVQELLGTLSSPFAYLAARRHAWRNPTASAPPAALPLESNLYATRPPAENALEV